MASGGTRAITNVSYLVDQDSSVSWETNPVSLELASTSLCWQFKWDAGVSGNFTAYASIFSNPFVWEGMVACDSVTFSTADIVGQSTIVALPQSWQLVGFIKWVFTPEVGSVGNTSAAIRIVPT